MSALDDMTVFREYEPHELGRDGYPAEWHRLTDPEHTHLLDAADLVLPGGIKDVVRALAGNRCVRCGHPYRVGFASAKGEWSPCDMRCTHGAPTRWRRRGDTEWRTNGERCAADSIPHGISRGFEIEAQWRILTVHHLDGAKANCRWWNLCPLDQRCHLEIQGKVRMDRRWLREHSPWFRPYVAGYYAWTFLGEDLSREQVEARLDELLALEDRQLALTDEARP